MKGRTANLEVTTEAQVDNGWAYFDYALVNETTGQTYEFGREVSYYHGRDSDGNWSEGSRRDRAVLPSVPAGPYFLRVQPEAQVPTDFLEYRIVVRRDVPIALPLPVRSHPARRAARVPGAAGVGDGERTLEGERLRSQRRR